jgi:hypothetical protein
MPAAASSAAVPGRIDAQAGASAVASATAALEACRARRGRCGGGLPAPRDRHPPGRHRLQRLPVAGGARVRPARGQRVPAAGRRRAAHRARHAARERGAPRSTGITPELLVAATRAGARPARCWACPNPSIGVFGINPHASEGGLFGPEDAAIAWCPPSKRCAPKGLRVTARPAPTRCWRPRARPVRRDAARPGPHPRQAARAAGGQRAQHRRRRAAVERGPRQRDGHRGHAASPIRSAAAHDRLLAGIGAEARA